MRSPQAFFIKLVLWQSLAKGEILTFASALAFPEGRVAGQIVPPPPVVLSERKLKAYAEAQGYCVSPDNPEGGYQYRYAAKLEGGRYRIFLYTPTDLRGERSKTGWAIVIDYASFSYCRHRGSKLAKEGQLLATRAEIYVSGTKVHDLEMGYGSAPQGPLVIPLPYILSEDGRVDVEIRIPYRPGSVLYLYDIFLRGS
ncbi:MAG: hypothetical protein NZM25_09625 [Leptospiraceae bacterium]|nr:hypothetical protein [Leptospiraceae bacterium]MDW8306417.1 hypothetical protein [Leptospiraceae bacterium]